MISNIAVVSVLLASLAASALLTIWLRAWARGRAMLDLPGARRNHRVPTPRGGGAAIVWVTELVAFACLIVAGLITPALIALLVGTAMVAWIGWRDDRGGTSVWSRLLVQTLAAVIVLIVLGQGADPGLPWWVWGIGALFMVGLTNIWNFMDGIDGIAVSQAILVAFGVFALAHADAVQILALLLASASLGFLPFNFPRASIFLGDVGSGAIGFLIGGLLLMVFSERGLPAIAPAVLLISAFLVDASMTLGKRLVQGKRWWRSHREHTYQWLVRAGYSHVRVSSGYALWTLAMLLLIVRMPTTITPWTTGAVLIFAVVVWLGLRCWVLRRATGGTS